jgi:hypothetical protein
VGGWVWCRRLAGLILAADADSLERRGDHGGAAVEDEPGHGQSCPTPDLQGLALGRSTLVPALRYTGTTSALREIVVADDMHDLSEHLLSHRRLG